MTSLSVIVPLGPGEVAWVELVSELTASAPVALANWERVEILWVIARDTDDLPARLEAASDSLRKVGYSVRLIESHRGRSRQMNAGAREAAGDAVFFLHADSRFDPVIFRALSESLGSDPCSLHFFDLKFYDGPPAMRINTCGVWIRSRVMGIPFGDQGFAIKREIHLQLEGFDELLEREEDHDYVWRAKSKGIALKPVGKVLATSARKYSEQGWMRITLLYGYLTFRRAIPALLKVMANRARSAG